MRPVDRPPSRRDSGPRCPAPPRRERLPWGWRVPSSRHQPAVSTGAVQAPRLHLTFRPRRFDALDGLLHRWPCGRWMMPAATSRVLPSGACPSAGSAHGFPCAQPSFRWHRDLADSRQAGRRVGFRALLPGRVRCRRATQAPPADPLPSWACSSSGLSPGRCRRFRARTRPRRWSPRTRGEPASMGSSTRGSGAGLSPRARSRFLA